jgi:hypothetical protein
MYKTLLNYLTEYHALDTVVLKDLIRAKNLPVERSYTLIPYIHSGYLDITLEKKEDGRD